MIMGENTQTYSPGCLAPVLTNMALWEFRGDVRAGLVPAQCGATTRVARTPRNPEDPQTSGLTRRGEVGGR